jgi:hypothetical protein
MPAKLDLATEAKADFVSMTFDGEVYTLPTADDFPIAFLEAMRGEEKDIVGAVLALIGPEQYARFRTTHGKASDLTRFFTAVEGKMGGNSSAS